MVRFYTTKEAADLLGVSLPTVVNWINARRLRAHRTPGGHRRIAPGDLGAFMLRHGMPLPGELNGSVQPRRKVLVIGDLEPGREGSARQLAQAGYAVEQASAGFAAGHATALFQPDVIILHTTSPDGGDTLRALRSDPVLRSVPVVAVGHSDWVPLLKAAGCTSAIGRPLADGSLVAAVTAALGVAVPAGRRARR